jgi:hypothetical protein
MLPILILVTIFLVAFVLGYAVHARRSHKHRVRYLTHAPYMTRS